MSSLLYELVLILRLKKNFVKKKIESKQFLFDPLE